MAQQMTRYSAANAPGAAEGWSVERITPVSRLFGANGIRTGADGRIYCAQVSGSQISAIDIESGAVEAISPKGGHIVAPDDLCFDDEGNIYATEITENRVGMLAPNGTSKVIWGDVPVANPITFHQGRLIVGECRIGARIMELDRNGGSAPRIIAENIPMANAFEVGPDGMLYFPVMAMNEIWRVSLDGGEPEKVAGDLGVPDAVKFDSKGFIVSTQVASGQVLRIDPRTGDKEVLASIAPGLDNVTFVGDRIFVSSISGQVNEILPGGKIRSVVPDGFNWPLGLAVEGDGLLWVADGPFLYTMRPGEKPEAKGMLFGPGYPGYVRGVAVESPGSVVVTSGNGSVVRYRPGSESETIAEGYQMLYGIALASDGTAVFADGLGGRVVSARGGTTEDLATGLEEPMGVALGSGGEVYVTENKGGRVIKIAGGRTDTVIDGLGQPQGIVVAGNSLFVLDALAKTVIEHDLSSGARSVIASDLPVGAPPGVVPKFMGPIGDLAGPTGPFAGLALAPDGTLYVSGDAEGSVLALRRA